MREDKRRYFIELHLSESEVPRNREAEMRRADALRFIGQIKEWIDHESLNDKVSSVAVTALGQVLITCDKDIIAHLRKDEHSNIAAIRSSLPLSQALHAGGRMW